MFLTVNSTNIPFKVVFFYKKLFFLMDLEMSSDVDRNDANVDQRMDIYQLLNSSKSVFSLLFFIFTSSLAFLHAKNSTSVSGFFITFLCTSSFCFISGFITALGSIYLLGYYFKLKNEKSQTDIDITDPVNACNAEEGQEWMTFFIKHLFHEWKDSDRLYNVLRSKIETEIKELLEIIN